MKVKTDTLSRLTLDTMAVGDVLTLMLPDYTKIVSSRANLSTYMKIHPKMEFTTKEDSENPNEFTIKRLK